MLISCRRIVAVVARAWNSEASAPAARVRLNAIAARTQPSAVGVELPRRQMGERPVLQVGDDLFDDRVPTPVDALTAGLKGLGAAQTKEQLVDAL
jgi:hypothetical protein